MNILLEMVTGGENYHQRVRRGKVAERLEKTAFFYFKSYWRQAVSLGESYCKKIMLLVYGKSVYRRWNVGDHTFVWLCLHPVILGGTKVSSDIHWAVERSNQGVKIWKNTRYKGIEISQMVFLCSSRCFFIVVPIHCKTLFEGFPPCAELHRQFWSVAEA